MPFQNLLINTFVAIKTAISPPPSPPPSALDSPTAKAIQFPSGYIAYDAEMAFQFPNTITSPSSGIWITTK